MSQHEVDRARGLLLCLARGLCDARTMADARHALGFTQAELACELSRPLAWIVAWEDGNVTPPQEDIDRMILMLRAELA